MEVFQEGKGLVKMTVLNLTDDYFTYMADHPECRLIVYGAGDEARKNYKFVGHVEYFCDQRAEDIREIDGIPCLLPEELSSIPGRLIILICIRDEHTARQVYEKLDNLEIDAEVFYFFQNPSFAEFDFTPYTRKLAPKERLRIRIVCTDESWILGKFARKLQEELGRMGQLADIADEEDPAADVNHYVYYASLAKVYNDHRTVRTAMVTHVDCTLKTDMIRFQTHNRVLCICMSAETVNRLSAQGVARDWLCYVNPAQDGDVEPGKIVLGITNRCYGGFDFRKRDTLILEVCRELEPRFFMLKIMGSGWEQIVSQIRQMGFEVEYYPDFERDIYRKLMPSLDYWIYYGFDEGAMGYLDALAAGVQTICTPQGYHLDTDHGLTYPCSTIADFVRTLRDIQEEKRRITDAVKDWTWENFARKHLEIWQYLTGAKPLRELYAHQSEYMDGIFSMILPDISER